MNEPLTQETTLLYGVNATNEFTVFRHGFGNSYIALTTIFNPSFIMKERGEAPWERFYLAPYFILVHFFIFGFLVANIR